MKTKIIRILCLFVAAMPLHSMAQADIQKSFDKLFKCSDAVYTENHNMEKDPQSGVKESQSDVYNFTLPADKISLVDNILNAFKKDEKSAYSTSRGTTGSNDRIISLAVGNGDDGVRINLVGRNYIYSCFLAPADENPTGNYRYAYGMNWEKNDGKITGMLVVTYATTLKSRQEQSVFKPQSSIIVSPDDTWFGMFMHYVQAMSDTNTATQQAMATKIYEHTKSVQSNPNVSEEDRDTAWEVLKSMIDRFQEPITSQVLNAALANME